MFNKGYVGYSRSARSQSAIDNYELPLSLIKKSVILDFIDDYNEYKELKHIPVAMWKYVAKSIGRSSWHHTSNRYNKTDHYSLDLIADELKDDYNKWETQYLKSKQIEKENKQKLNTQSELRLTVVTSQIWGGSRKRPKLIGHEEFLAVVKGNTAYPVTQAENIKYKLSANKNDYQKLYAIDEYNNLVKEYPVFKANKRKINRMVKELIK